MVDILEFCKREIANSNQWKIFSQQLFIHIRQHLNASNVMFLTDLSEQERLHVTTQAMEVIKASNYGVFQEMLSEVSSTIDKRINEYTSLHKGNRSRNDVLMETLAALSSRLLFKWPNHKHLLLQCFNRALPAALRATMWQLMLQNKQVYHSFVTKATSVASQDPRSSSYRDYEQCQQLIGSSKMFSALMENRLSLQVMKDVLTFWRLQCSKDYISQLDILLCIPFVYVRLSELEIIKERNNPTMEQFTGSVCEQYISFMTQRPPTMMDERLTSTQNAMLAMLKRVFQILHGADKTLYQSLRASLTMEPSSLTSGEDVFAAQLIPLLHPYVQRLFVGHLPMDVVCFIWDQCFLGLGIGEYQYIPYLIATLLLIMRESLLQCKEATAISHIILNNLSLVTVPQIQLTIERYFLTELAAHLKSPKLPASHTPYVDPLLEPIPQWSHFTGEHQSVLPSWKEIQKQRREQDEAKKRELQEAKEAAAKIRRQHENQVTELQAEVTRLREELAAVKLDPQQVNNDLNSDRNVPSPQATNNNKSSDNIKRSSVISNANSLLSFHSSSSRHAGSTPPTPQATSLDHVTSSAHSVQTSESADATRQQVQEIWLTILGKFANAVDLVCHGTSEN